MKLPNGKPIRSCYPRDALVKMHGSREPAAVLSLAPSNPEPPRMASVRDNRPAFLADLPLWPPR